VVRCATWVLVVAALAGVAGCGDRGPTPRSGISGLVHLWPVCPVEQVGMPCVDLPAGHVAVVVHRPRAADGPAVGRTVATGHTDEHGTFRIAVDPGTYVVTADAGTSCEVAAVRVWVSTYAEVDVACTTGIR
jgi:hypothetical protein